MDRIMRRNAESERQRTSVLQLIKDAASSVKNKAADLYGRFRSRSGEEDEDKKASVWMRKLRALFDPVGRALKKMKSGGSKLGNLLSMIGKPLLLALMNPQLIRSITDAVSKYLNFDTISKFISDTWDSTKKLGSESITWIVDKVKGFFGFGSDKKKAATPVKRADPLERKLHTGALPKSITPSQAQSVLPNYQTQLTNAKQQLTQAQAAYAQNPSATNKKAVEDAQRNVNFYQTRVTQYQARASEGKTAGSSIEQAQTLVSPSTTPTSTDSAGAPTATTVNSVAPSTVVGSSSVAAPVTTVVADTPKFEPGKAFTPPGTMDEVEKSIDKTGAATSQISIGSFGFDSNDSALNILNLGMLA